MKQKIHFVTGKGGVGKSAVAAALALKLSQSGQKVLLAELGDQSFYKDYFALSDVNYKGTSLSENLSVALWSGRDCLKEYARHLVKVEALANLFFENAVMRTFIDIAPGLAELAILGKVTSGPRQHGPPSSYDAIVVDAYATGHFKALLEAPRGMAQAISFGPMGEQSRSIEACLKNPEVCFFHVVTLPAELPLKEGCDLAAFLRNEFSIDSELYVNKFLEVGVSFNDLETFRQEDSDMGRFADYLAQQVSHQERLVTKFENEYSISMKKIPLLFQEEPVTLIKKMSEVL